MKSLILWSAGENTQFWARALSPGNIWDNLLDTTAL